MIRLWTASLLALAALLTAGPATAANDASASEDKPQRIARLIRQLGDADYFARQDAQNELAKYGFEAFDALSAATLDEDLEVASRARYLMRLVRVEWTVESDPAEVKRHLREYEFKDSGGRIVKMKSLAGLAGGAGVPALCRLVRYEPSTVLSKEAALQVLSRDVAGQPPKPELAETLRKSLAGSKRAAALWLLTYARFADDPTGALAQWKKLAEDEERLLRRTPKESDPQFVSALLRVQLNWLEKAKRIEEATEVMTRLIDLSKGDPETLAELIGWLIDQKAWASIDQVKVRFAVRFASHAGLMYLYAESQLVRGDKKQADELSLQASKFNPGRSEESLLQHMAVGRRLVRRGRFDWAEREYRTVIERGGAGQPIVVTTQQALSEMLHDLGEDLRAAEVLQETVKAAGRNRPNDEDYYGRTFGETKSRMHYFFSLDWQRKGDTAKQKQALDSALEAAWNDVDVLIACFRLPNQSAEYRKRISDYIRKAADEMREQIADDPQNATNYNQFAWLIGNTEGDYDEALKASKTSIELEPEAGGYYDTLGRCYYAKADYDNAVKFQSRAMELEPHSGLIRRQLDLFRQAQAQAKQGSKP